MKIIRRSEYHILPWKNGLGTTELIAIDFNEPFNWRLSAATINSPNFFSEYPGYKRWLTIWTGNGLLLNEYKLIYGIAHEFYGDEKIHCKNLSPEVIDIGLIYNPKKVSAKNGNYTAKL